MSHSKRGILAWFASKPVAANLLMALILISGALVFSNLRLESFPALPPSNVTVDVSFDSGSAAVAEEGIALKIEQALQGISGVKSLTSVSSGEGVTVTVERTSGYDLKKLHREIKNRIDGIANLPQSALSPVTTAQSFLEDAIRIQLWGQVSQDSLQDASRKLRQILLQDPNIDSVSYVGRKTAEIRIQLDLHKMQALGLTISDISTRVASSSTSASAGELFSERGKLVIKANQQAYWQNNFADIVILQNISGLRVHLSDIAIIDDSYRQTSSLSRFNGQPAQGLQIQLREQSDIKKIAAAVKLRVAKFRQSSPQPLNITIWEDKSGYITSRLDLLTKNSLQGVLLVMLLLALFLNLRLAFWVGLGLPVVFAGASLLMAPVAFNLTINELTTFGFIMVLGIVVDDAVVVSESIYSHREKEGATLAATIAGVQKVSTATIFGVLTTIVAFMSITFIEGEMGQIFANFAYAAAFCLAFSMLESKLILPAHLASLKMSTDRKPNILLLPFTLAQQYFKRALQHFTYRRYRPFMHQAIKHRYSVTICAVAILIAVAGMLPAGKVRFIFFPNIPSDTVQINIEFAADAPTVLVQRQSLEVERVIAKSSKDLTQTYSLKQPPVKNLMTNIDDTQALLIAELSPRNARPLNTDQLVEKWREQLIALEGVVKIDFVTSFDDGSDIDIELAAQDIKLLENKAEKIITKLSKMRGVSAVKSSLQTRKPQYEITLSPQGVALGLNLLNVIEQVQRAVQGYDAQQIQRNASEVKVILRYRDDQRRNRFDLSRILISDSKGNRFPLNAIANIESQVALSKIYRADNQRVANITATVDKKVTSTVIVLDTLQSELLRAMQIDTLELAVILRGEAQEQAKTTGSLSLIFIIAMLIIYSLLAIPLNSYFQPLTIMLAIPFGVVGAILGHWFHDVPLSLLSMFGILALSGVVVNDSLLLITTYNSLRANGITSKVAIIHAACSRMRAIVLTSSTTFIGLLPLISETSEQAQFLIPAAISMGYGIVFATAITLIIIPVAILIGEDIRKHIHLPRDPSHQQPSMIESKI